MLRRLHASPLVVWLSVLAALIALMAAAPIMQAEATPAPVCEWVPTCDWGPCVCAGSHCGAGLSIRKIGCKCNGKIVNDIYCRGCVAPKPPSSKACIDTSGCPAKWSYSNWCACDKDCMRHRTAKCMAGGQEVDPKRCGPCAELHQPCPDNDPTRFGKCKPPKVECEWSDEKFCDCPVKCGGGLRTRPAAKCVPKGPLLKDRSACDVCAKKHACRGPPPATSEPCNTEPCKPKCEWQFTGDFCKCDKDCGGGQQSREASCGVIGASAFTACPDRSGCKHQEKPAPESKKCNEHPCCEWSQEKFCDCPVKCGGGLRTRPPAKCQPVGPLLTDKHACAYCSKKNACPPPAPATSEPCNTEACKPKCEWSPVVWSECPACGPAKQKGTSKCVAVGFSVSKHGYDPCSKPGACNEKDRPACERDCDIPKCPKCKWQAGPWSDCPTCGHGKRTREVKCASKEGRSLGPDPCKYSDCAKEKKPETEKPCKNQPPCVQCEWSDPEFCACPVTCGGGVRTREPAKCQPVGPLLKDKHACAVCSKKNACKPPAPVTSEPCNTQKCPKIKCEWQHTGPFSECDAKCGEGKQSREASCGVVQKQYPAGLGAPVFQACPDPRGCLKQKKPAPQTKPCSGPPCCAWESDPFCECSASCGGGVRTRPEPKCVSVGKSLDKHSAKKCKPADCDAATKPPTSEACGTKECPKPKCDWQYTGDFCKCDKDCGGGEQSREASCGVVGAAVFTPCSDKRGCKKPKPAPEKKKCNEQPCCAWKAEEFCECPVKCGGGEQTRPEPVCAPVGPSLDKKHSGHKCKPKDCSGDKPPTSQKCNTEPCKPTCEWSPVVWSECPACGPAKQKGTTKCVAVGISVSKHDSDPCSKRGACNEKDKPDLERACDIPKCPKCVWKEGPWSETCPACGPGKQTRDVQCVSAGLSQSINSPKPDPCQYSDCDKDKKPAKEQDCVDQPPCAQCQWSEEDWDTTACPICGPGGEKTRKTQCVPIVKSLTNSDNPCKGACKKEDKPKLKEPCESPACVTCKWSEETWSTCPACGPAEQTRPEATCVPSDPLIDLPNPCGAADACAGAGDQPSTKQDCEIPKCPKCSWQFTGEFGACETQGNKPCGWGKQYREAQCGITAESINAVPSPSPFNPCPDEQLCTKKKPDPEKLTCSLGPCCEWTDEKWSKCSAECKRTRDEAECKKASGMQPSGSCSGLCPLPAPSTSEDCTGDKCPK